MAAARGGLHGGPSGFQSMALGPGATAATGKILVVPGSWPPPWHHLRHLCPFP